MGQGIKGELSLSARHGRFPQA